jgi:hypothetical protein
MHQPTDIVTPDDLYNFIRQSAVSEELATGIKLLRRAADTIAWNNSELYRLEDKLESLDGDNQGQTNFDEQWQAAGEKLATALGSPVNLSFDQILQAIIELREFKEQYDEPCDRACGSVADGNAYSETGKAVDPNDWAKQVTNFAHTVYGFSLASDSPHSGYLRTMAKDIINTSPVK